MVAVVENKTEHVLDTMLNNNFEMIFFDFAPEKIDAELKKYYEIKKKIEEEKNKKKPYIINFYENKGTFIVDLTGSLDREKISGLKLMFANYLATKIKNLKGVIYVFNNTDDKTMNFCIIWLLFRFWKELGIPYKNIYYLTSSEYINKNILEYTNFIGVKHSLNLIDIVKHLYPEVAKKNEMELFDFASNLLQSDSKSKSSSNQ